MVDKGSKAQAGPGGDHDAAEKRGRRQICITAFIQPILAQHELFPSCQGGSAHAHRVTLFP